MCHRLGNTFVNIDKHTFLIDYTYDDTLHVTLQGYIASDPYSSLYGDTHYYNYREDNWDWRLYPRTRSLCDGDLVTSGPIYLSIQHTVSLLSK